MYHRRSDRDPNEQRDHSQDWQRDAVIANVERLLVEKADRLEPELWTLEQPPRDSMPEPSGADDQRLPGSLAVSPSAHLGGVEGGPTEHDPRGGEQPVANR